MRRVRSTRIHRWCRRFRNPVMRPVFDRRVNCFRRRGLKFSRNRSVGPVFTRTRFVRVVMVLFSFSGTLVRGRVRRKARTRRVRRIPRFGGRNGKVRFRRSVQTNRQMRRRHLLLGTCWLTLPLMRLMGRLVLIPSLTIPPFGRDCVIIRVFMICVIAVLFPFLPVRLFLLIQPLISSVFFLMRGR